MGLPAKKIARWWEANAEAYQRTYVPGTTGLSYDGFTLGERRLNLLGSVKGKRVIELGCGGGQNAVVLARNGARVTALDVSKNELAFAERLAQKNKVKVDFIRHDIQSLRGFKSNSYDIALSVYALKYVPDLNACFREACRVLKPGGILVFSFNHPLYSIIDKKTFRVKAPYKTGPYTFTGAWGSTKTPLTAFRNTMGSLVNGLVGAGFMVERIVEDADIGGYKRLHSDRAWKSYWGKDYPLALIKLIPPTIIMKARKL